MVQTMKVFGLLLFLPFLISKVGAQPFTPGLGYNGGIGGYTGFPGYGGWGGTNFGYGGFGGAGVPWGAGGHSGYFGGLPRGISRFQPTVNWSGTPVLTRTTGFGSLNFGMGGFGGSSLWGAGAYSAPYSYYTPYAPYVPGFYPQYHYNQCLFMSHCGVSNPQWYYNCPVPWVEEYQPPWIPEAPISRPRVTQQSQVVTEPTPATPTPIEVPVVQTPPEPVVPPAQNPSLPYEHHPLLTNLQGLAIPFVEDPRCLARYQRYVDSAKTDAGVCSSGTCSIGPVSPLSQTNATAVTKIANAADPSVQIAAGARKVMATLYQNCKALEVDNIVCSGSPLPVSAVIAPDIRKSSLRQIVNPNEVVTKIQYYNGVCDGNQRLGESRECKMKRQKACEKPAVFNLGRRAKILVSGSGTGRSLTLNMFESDLAYPGMNTRGKTEVKHGAGSDCSEAISKFFMASGRKMRRTSDTDPTTYHMTTKQLFDGLTKPNTSCFSAVDLRQGIKPGDVIIRPPKANSGETTGHGVMVDRVYDNDPWGLQSWPKRNGKTDCENGNVQYFKFDVIQSSGFDHRDIVRSPANDFYQHVDKITGKVLLGMATRACLAQTQAQTQVDVGFGQSTDGYDVVIARHNEHLDCQSKIPVKVTGEDCLKCDFNK